MANEGKDARSSLDSLGFLIGDWTGHGVQHFGENKSMEFDVRMMCRKTEDGSGLEMIEFDDNLDQGMFHGEQSFIYMDEKEGKLRLRRTWFESGYNSILTFLEDVSVKEGEIVASSPPRKADAYLSTLSIKKGDESTLLSEGKLHFDNKDWPLEVTFKRVGSK